MSCDLCRATSCCFWSRVCRWFVGSMFMKMALKNYETIDWVELWVLSPDGLCTQCRGVRVNRHVVTTCQICRGLRVNRHVVTTCQICRGSLHVNRHVVTTCQILCRGLRVKIDMFQSGTQKVAQKRGSEQRESSVWHTYIGVNTYLWYLPTLKRRPTISAVGVAKPRE